MTNTTKKAELRQIKAAAYIRGFVRGLDDGGCGHLAGNKESLEKATKLASALADASDSTKKKLQPVMKRALECHLNKLSKQIAAE